jgi:hypothetical protein
VVLVKRLSFVASLLACSLLAACKSESPPAASTTIDRNNELPFGYIDVPAAGQHVPRMFVTTGWALDDGGVVDIRVFIDNKFFMTIDRRTVRDDLKTTFPTYTNGTRRHGWLGTVELPATVPAGPHHLLVQVTDTGGLTRDLGQVSFILDPVLPPPASGESSPPPTLAGELPVGAVDLPKENAKVSRTFEVLGWAVDDRGIREIRVFVDRAFNSIIPAGRDRRDVLQLHPEWAAANPLPGWSGSLTLTPGPHSLIFQAVDTDGLTRVLGIVAVVVSD